MSGSSNSHLGSLSPEHLISLDPRRHHALESPETHDRVARASGVDGITGGIAAFPSLDWAAFVLLDKEAQGIRRGPASGRGESGEGRVLALRGDKLFRYRGTNPVSAHTDATVHGSSPTRARFGRDVATRLRLTLRSTSLYLALFFQRRRSPIVRPFPPQPLLHGSFSITSLVSAGVGAQCIFIPSRHCDRWCYSYIELSLHDGVRGVWIDTLALNGVLMDSRTLPCQLQVLLTIKNHIRVLFWM